jgi:ankyrin repeat protein
MLKKLTSIFSTDEDTNKLKVLLEGSFEQSNALLQQNDNAFNKLIKEILDKILYRLCVENKLDIFTQLIEKFKGEKALEQFLFVAIQNKWDQAAHCLLQNDVNPNIFDEEHRTPLSFAIEIKNPALTELLIKFGAKMEKNKKGSHKSIYRSIEVLENPEILKVFLENKPNMVNELSLYDIHDLIIKNNRPSLTLLIQSGLSLYDLKDDDGRTALMVACRYGSFESVEFILKHSNLDAQDRYGNSAMMFALEKEDIVKKVKLLISAGSNLNLTDKHGKTALMKCAENCDFLSASELIKAGADLNIKLDGKSAIEMIPNYNAFMTFITFKNSQ